MVVGRMALTVKFRPINCDPAAPTTLTPDDLRHHVTRLQSENSRLRTIISRLNYEPLYHTSTSRCSLLTTEDDHLQTQTTDVRATNSDFLAEISVLHQQVQNSDDRNDRRVFIELQNAKAQLQLIQGEKLAVECEVFDLQSKIAKLGKDGKKATQ